MTERPANCICDHDRECHGIKDGPACVGGGLAGNCQCEAGWSDADVPILHPLRSRAGYEAWKRESVPTIVTGPWTGVDQ